MGINRGSAANDFPIYDQSARAPALAAYVFVSATGEPAEISGFLTDIDGNQVSGLLTISVGQEPVTFAGGLQDGLPQGAYGFVGRLTGNVFFGTGADHITGEVAQGLRPGEKWPILTAREMFAIGRVSV